MQVDSGKVVELTEEQLKKTTEELLKERLVPLPDEYAGAFRKQGRGMKDAAERIAAAKSARRKADKVARASRRKNR